MRHAEEMVHSLLNDYRIGSREFFRTSVAMVRETMDTIPGTYEENLVTYGTCITRASEEPIIEEQQLECDNSNTEYNCKRCGYTSSYKSDMAKHLRKKYECLPKESDISTQELLEELFRKDYSNAMFACSYCDQRFNSKSTRTRHHKSVKNDQPIMTLQ